MEVRPSQSRSLKFKLMEERVSQSRSLKIWFRHSEIADKENEKDRDPWKYLVEHIPIVY